MFDVSLDDPSEWPLEFIGLKKIDSLLRCSICFELFNIAMIIPCCSHNYCSLCIRKHISYKERCPTCNASLVGGDLKCNRILDELVRNFKSIREKLLEILKLYTDNGFTQETVNKNKAIRDDNVYGNDEFQFDKLPVYRDPNNSQNKSRVGRKKRRGDGGEVEMKSCPACSEKVPLQEINLHLDVCLEDENKRKTNTDDPSTSRVTRSTKKKKESVPSSVKNIMKPIVLTASLNALQDKELKSKASQYGLSLQGNRKQLMKRIEQYILLHNSQCDALNPMSLSMIVREVSKNERNLLVHGYTPSIVPSSHGLGCSNQDDVDFTIKHAKKHEGQYQQLINEVKGRPSEKIHTRSQTKGIISNQSVNIDGNNDNNDNELIEIYDSDRTDKEEEEQEEEQEEEETSNHTNKEAEQISSHSAFGYVPSWFDADLLKANAANKKVSHTNVDSVKVNVNDNVAVDKGIKRKAKKNKSVTKKKSIQSGNIASYFAGNKTVVKTKALKHDTICDTKVKNKDPTCIFLVDDSDEQSDNDKSINTSSQKCPPMHATEDVDDELMPHSPSLLETHMTENIPELAEELESDVGDAFHSTAVPEPDEESLFISNDLSPVLFKESSPKHNLPCHSRSRISCLSGGNLQKGVDLNYSLDSQLSLEISNLVDKAVEDPQTFSSDSENDNSLMKSNLIPIKRILDNNSSMRKENNPDSQNVIPVPPTDFCFSQAEF